MKLSQLAATLAIAVITSVGCGTDDPSDKTNSCTTNVDCEPGFHCGTDNKCVQECNPDSAMPMCAAGESCDSLGRCVVAGECVIDDDCDSPPTDAACEGDTLVGYSQVGTCAAENGENVCNYAETRTTCETGCLGGACIPDSCEQLTCDSPPPPVCDADGMTLIEYSDPGVCTDGVCEYAEAGTSCALGCQAGVCLAGTCDSVTCNQPPADECDGDTAITYSAMGMCVDFNGSAICDYMPVFDNCMYEKGDCNNAACENPITQVGGILITEYTANPAGSFQDIGEWFEIVNISGADIDLNSGWMIRSKGTSSTDEEHPFVGAPTLAAGARMTLVYSASVPFAYDYNYADVRLANNSDWLEIVNPAGEIADYVFYEGGAILAGRSRKYDPGAVQDVTANDDFASWCPSMGDQYDVGAPGNFGTPGAANTPCVADPCAGFTCEKPSGFCIDADNKAVQYVDQNATCESTRFNNPLCDFDTMEVQCTNGTQLCAFGVCETIPTNLPQPGELIISEMMPNPASRDTDREWIEVYNTTGGELALFSMIFRDNEMAGSRNEYQFLDPTAMIPANGYLTLARNTDPAQNGGVTGASLYSGAHLKNNPDPTGANTPAGGMKLLLTLADGTVIDEAYYDNPENEDSSFPSGRSLQLDPDALTASGNDERANWCFATVSYGDGGNGSPGAANEQCP